MSARPQERAPDPTKDKRNPDIDGNIVVWEDMRNATQDIQGWWHNPDIYMKNLSTGVEGPVCTNTSDQYNPVVSGNRIFWQDFRNGNWDIYMKDLSTGAESRLTTNTAYQSWPSVSGNFLVWKDQREGDEDIYFKNLATMAAEQRVNTDPAADSRSRPEDTRHQWRPRSLDGQARRQLGYL